MKRSTLVYQFQLQVAVVLIKLPHAATSHKDFSWETYVAVLRLNSSKQL